jgi:DNA-binding LacI/PurR family transcriptional regulator
MATDAGAGRDPRRVTSVDVAREAGLSRATVSYVLNDTPHQSIPEATRRRVLEAAARLGYTPSAAARALRSGRSDVVLFLLPDWPIGTTVGRLLEHLSDALADRGLVLVAHPRGPRSRPAAHIWTATGPAAVLGWEEFDEAEVAAMDRAGVRVAAAMLGGGPQGGEGATQQRIGRLQVEHLVAAGHRRLGYASSDDERVRDFAVPRLAGVRQACAELGLDQPLVRTVPNDPRGAAEAVTAWRVPTGVCAYNDEVALAVLAGMRAHGLRAPDDLAVVGVDDIPAAATADPPLSTVSTDLRAYAEYLAGVTRSRLDGTSPPSPPGPDTVSVTARASA